MAVVMVEAGVVVGLLPAYAVVIAATPRGAAAHVAARRPRRVSGRTAVAVDYGVPGAEAP